MSTPISRLLAPIIVLFAIVGFGTYLVTEPLKLLRTILIIAVVIGGVFLIYKLFFQGKFRKTESAYERAVKQSKQRQQRKQKRRVKPAHLKVIRSNNNSKKRSLIKQTNHNLTVIDGKKNKKKNRALY